ALAGAQVAPGHQRAPVPPHDLYRALRPPAALLAERREVVGRQALAHHAIDVDGRPAAFHQAQAELGILADRPFGPLAVLAQRARAHQRHRAVLDDRVAFVAMVHADAEEAVVLVVHHAAERLALPVAVRLRR